MLKQLRKANQDRMAEWDQNGLLDSSFFGNELAGEVGEACNVIKKLERERLGIVGSRATIQNLADELSDIIIVCDLIAARYNIDLDKALPRKFNETSDKRGFLTKFSNI